MFLLQIIHKIKLQRSEVDMTPSEICDRIFELVDQNHDGENGNNSVCRACHVLCYMLRKHNMFVFF